MYCTNPEGTCLYARGTQRRGYPWNAYNNPRKEASRPYKPNWWDRYGGGGRTKLEGTLYMLGDLKERVPPGCIYYSQKGNLLPAKSQVLGHKQEGGGTNIRGQMSVFLLTKVEGWMKSPTLGNKVEL